MFVFAINACLSLTFHWQAEVFAKVEELFKDAPDLSSAFRDFLPGAGSAPDADGLGMLRGPSTRTGTPSGEHARAQKRKQPAESAPTSASAPAKRRRKAADRDKDKERDGGRASGSRVSVLLVYLRLAEND
jgi:paired amphipathic helix protein Sin3a